MTLWSVDLVSLSCQGYFFSTLSANLLTLATLTEKTYGFCIISFFRSWFFFLILFKKPYFLQQIQTFGVSRAGETLTCAKMLLFTIFQALLFQGGAPGEA